MEWNDYHRIQLGALSRGANDKDLQVLFRSAKLLGTFFPTICAGKASIESLCIFLWFQLAESGAHRVGEAMHCFAFKQCESVIGGTTTVVHQRLAKFKISNTLWKKAFRKIATKPSDAWSFLAGVFSSRCGTIVLHQEHGALSLFFQESDFEKMTMLLRHMESTQIPFEYTDDSVLISERHAAHRFLLGVQTRILCPAKREVAIYIISGASTQAIIQRSKELEVPVAMLCL
jgi:hypothetical protein